MNGGRSGLSGLYYPIRYRDPLMISEARSAKLDGIELLAAVKASSPDLPVVLLGNDVDRPLIDAARAGGASAWVVTPIDPARLAAAVTQLSL